MVEVDNPTGKKKVRTPDGHVGWVVKQLNAVFCTVQIRRGGYYPVYRLADLTEITEDEFTKQFR